MMAVASKLVPSSLLALSLAACAGNVIEGLPRDGGVVSEEPTGQTHDAGTRDAMVLRDATIGPSEDASSSSSKDAGNGGGGKDAAAAQADSGGPSNGGNDAGTSSTALNPGYLARPTDNGRKYTANMSDWTGSTRCNEGTGSGQVVFCDDFESQDVGGGVGPAWSIYGSNVSTSDDQPFRGTKSMRYSPPSGMPAQQQETKTFPMLQNKLFGRVFVYFFTDLPSTPNDAHWTLIEVGGSDNNAQVRLGGQVDPSRDNKNFFGVGSDGGDTGDWHTKGLEPESEVKKGSWTCLEWMFDGDANETRVWINNVEQLSLHTTAANYRAGDAEGGKQFIHPTYGYLKIGYWVYQSSTQPDPAVVFLDELILDDEQIGCAL
jgi:hypothetical protein